MWIIPKQLHTSAYVADMEALGLDSSEFCQLSETSLMWRSKPSLSRTWSQRWKRVSWMRALSGRTLKHSISRSFAERWTSSLEATLASPSASQENDLENKIHDTYGRILRKAFEQQDLLYASSRTWKDIYQRASEKYRTAYADWVTQLRLEYSQRQKSARHTSASDCSSLELKKKLFPTPQASEAEKYRLTGNSQSTKCLSAMAVRGELANSQQDQKSSSTNGKSQELNPSWVDQLMGLTVGWTSLGSWEMESTQKQQSSHLYALIQKSSCPQ